MITITKKGTTELTHIKMSEMLNYPNDIFQEYVSGKPVEWYFINPGIAEENLIIIWYDDEDNEYKLSTDNKKGLKEYGSHVTAVKVTNKINISINMKRFKAKMNNPSIFIDKMKDVVRCINEAQNIMQSGPLSFYFEKLVTHSDALLSKFTPIPVGAKAIIIRQIECKGGWLGSEKTLAVGQIGTVISVDYDNNKFWFRFVPDKQWFKNNDGEYCEKKNLNSYHLSEHELCLYKEVL